MTYLNDSDFKNFTGIKEFKAILKSKLDVKKYQKILKSHEYQTELLKLQTELVDLQQWVAKHKKRVCIIFEGRDAAGKGGAIRRFTEHMNPRSMRVVALTKPTESEKGQWYFRRYIKELPEPGEIVFLTEVGTIEQLLSLLWDFAQKVNIINIWFKFQSLSICYMKMELLL